VGGDLGGAGSGGGDLSPALASSIHGLADMVAELSGMLKHWTPNVTVKTVPVIVNIRTPPAPPSPPSSSATPSLRNPMSSTDFIRPPVQDKQLRAPIFQPDGGVFDGAVSVNITTSDEDDSEEAQGQGNSSTIYYLISDPLPATSYKSLPLVRADIFGIRTASNDTRFATDNASAADGQGAQDGSQGNRSAAATAKDIEEGGEVFGEAIVLGPGQVEISAFVSRPGWANSPVVTQRYDVVQCASDTCCQWSLVYHRVRLLLDSLIAKNASLSRRQSEVEMEVQHLHEDWLSSNSQYRAATIQMKDDKVVAQYDLGEQEMWEEAVRGSAAQVTAVKREVKQHVSDLQQERALIGWILEQLSAFHMSPSVALSRVEQSLTQVHGLAVMGDLQKTLEAARAMSGGGGRGRLSSLAAGEGGYGEFEEVAAILRELVADLAQRELVFDRMVSSARAHLEANTRSYAEWQEKLNTGAAEEEMARAVMSSQEQRRHVLAGRLLVAQQQVDSLAEGLPAQAAMLSATIASYQRVVARLLENSQHVCAPVALEEHDTEENLKEEDSLPQLMMKLRQRKQEAKRLQTLIRETRLHDDRYKAEETTARVGHLAHAL